MAKDTFLSQNKVKIPLITKTVKKNSIWVISLLMMVFLTFNFFMMLQLNSYFKDTIDSRLLHELEHIKLSVTFENDSLKIIHASEFEESDLTEISETAFFLQIFDTSNNILFSSKNLDKYESIPFEKIDFETEYYFTDLNVKYAGLRTGYTKFLDSDNQLIGFIQLSTPKIKMNEVVEKIIIFSLYTLPIIIFLFELISLFFIKRTLRPINKIINVANEISATNISKRITYEAENTDELGRLKQTLNDLFDRLEFQIDEIAHFSDNASHQLMTPLTVMNTELDFILKNEHTSDDYKESLKVVHFQTKQMIHIVKTLLILARDCEVCASSKNVFNFSALVEDDISKNYKDQNVSFDVEEKIYLLGESDYFKMVIENVLGNALKYSNNGEVFLSGRISGDRVVIKIEDKGIGIQDDEKEKVFERFYRGSGIVKNGIKGYGLGLSIASLVVTKMNGKIYIADNTPQGSIFVIDLPLVNLI
ncbi:MAG: HAMP domain-containing histidine kinase [Melioribacteraceae bacterium]|nr:HAMP domain-containing histidine kinase [Melioribacteraceae bacterium]